MSVESFTVEELDEMRVTLGMLSAAPGLARTRAARIAAVAAKAERIAEQMVPGLLVYAIEFPLEVEVPRPSRSKKGKPRPPRAPLRLLLAPRLNEYAAMEPWTLALVREELDRRIEAAKTLWPAWDCGSVRTITETRQKKRIMKKLTTEGGRRRIVRVTRHSSREVDELAVDILGGKLPVDRLHWAGVISGDTRKHIVRDPRWQRAKPGGGKLVVEVFELGRSC